MSNNERKRWVGRVAPGQPLSLRPVDEDERPSAQVAQGLAAFRRTPRPTFRRPPQSDRPPGDPPGPESQLAQELQTVGEAPHDPRDALPAVGPVRVAAKDADAAPSHPGLSDHRTRPKRMYSEDEVRELVAVEVRRQLEPVSDALATIRNLLMQGGFSVDEAAGEEHVDEAEQLAQFGPEVPPLEPEPDPDEPSSATPSWIQGKSETFAPAPAQA